LKKVSSPKTFLKQPISILLPPFQVANYDTGFESKLKFDRILVLG
jgi:hypothetical protein